jgi:type IV pilus assembly protein PilM
MANPFSDILKTVQSALGGLLPKSAPSGSVAGIDIGSSSIKVVQVKKSGGAIVLETYGEIALAPYMKQPLGTAVTPTPEIITTALKDLFKEAHITASDFVISIPSPSTLIFVLTLPKASEANLHAIISNEARKFIPVPMSEVALDYITLPNRQTYADEAAGIEGNIEVLVVAVRSDTLSQYQNITTMAALDPYELEVEVFSIIRSGFRHEITPTMIIDMGAKTTRICIVEYGVVRMFNVINRGSMFITEILARSLNVSFEKAEELKRTYYKHDSVNIELVKKTIQDAYMYIISEADAVLLQYQRNSQKVVQKVILSGGGVLLHEFDIYVAEHFKLPTELIKSFDKAQTPEFLALVLAETSPTFAVSAGLALKKFL